MRYAQLRSMDITNGEGIGVALFVQGCDFRCKCCFNSNTWDFNGGHEWNENIENNMFNMCGNEYINHLSILGGEPMHPNNACDVIRISKKFKELYPNKKIWVWTGYLIDNIPNNEILEYADYIIDGQYDDSKKDFRLKFRGSSNQRVWEKGTDGIWVLKKTD